MMGMRSFQAARHRDKHGIALIWVVLWLPVFILLSGATMDVGVAFADRALLRAASDLGALAGVQELDLVQLAEGRRYIYPDRAKEHAERITRLILSANRNWSDVQVEVWVNNPPPGGGVQHPISGRFLRDPTVTVRSTVERRAVFLARVLPRYELTAYADASVLPRRE